MLGAGGWLAGVGRGKIGWSEPGLGFGGASLTERPTAGGGGATAGRRFEGEGGDGVVGILFFRYRLDNRCQYQLTTALLGALVMFSPSRPGAAPNAGERGVRGFTCGYSLSALSTGPARLSLIVARRSAPSPDQHVFRSTCLSSKQAHACSQILTFRPLPIKPHGKIIGKG